MANPQLLFQSIRIDPTTRDAWIFALVYQALLTCIVLVFIVLSHGTLAPSVFRARRSSWDGSSYVYLGTQGYTTVGEKANYIAFYPLYPMLIQTVNTVLPSSYLSAVSVTIVGSIIGHILLYLFFLEHPLFQKRAVRILLLLCASPISVYFTLVCTEGIFLMWTAAFLYFMQKKKYPAAVAFGFLASCTRLVGIVTIVYFVIDILEKEKFRRIAPHIFLAPIIAFGFGLFLLLNVALFSNPFHYQKILKDNWQKSIVNPVEQYVDTVRGLPRFQYTKTPTFTIDVLTTLSFPIVVLLARRQTWIAGTVWAIATWLIIVSQSYWLSNTRYLGLIIPLYVMIERLASVHRIVYIGILTACSAFALWSVYLFSIGAWLF